MGLLDRLKSAVSGTNNENTYSSSDVSPEDAEKLIEYALDQGIKINHTTARKICALNNGITLISETIASLPLVLYKPEGKGAREIIKDERYNLLNLENYEYSTSFNMKKKLVVDYILHGNGYLDICKAGGKYRSLINIDHSEMSPKTNSAINKRHRKFKYHYWGMERSFHEVLNLVRNPKEDDVTGVGILQEGESILGTAKGLEEYSYNTVNNGFYAKGIVESEKVIAKPSRESLGTRIKKFFSGSKNAGKVLILDDGMTFKSLSLSPVDIELLKQKEFTINDIARLLNLPPAMIGGTGNSMTYTNVQDTQLQFLQTTIEPYLTIIENTFNKYLLTEAEKLEGFYYEFNTINMLRTTPSKQIEMLTRATGRPVMTVNEARNEMNLAPTPEGEKLANEFKKVKGGEGDGAGKE